MIPMKIKEHAFADGRCLNAYEALSKENSKIYFLIVSGTVPSDPTFGNTCYSEAEMADEFLRIIEELKK